MGGQWCKMTRCAVRDRGHETCAECAEFPCHRFEGWDQGDSFVSHLNSLSNLRAIREGGLEAFVAQQRERIDLLAAMLAEFDRRDWIWLAVAPEGTRVAGEGGGEFKKGAFRMAMAARVPIVPIVIRNMDDIATPASGTMQPGTVDVVVLPPVRVEGWTQRDLGRRIAAVRQSFVDTLEHWPAGPGKRHARRKRREAS